MHLLSHLLTADVTTDTAAWVPASVLLWALGASVGIIVFVLTLVLGMLRREVAKFEKTLERLDARLLIAEAQSMALNSNTATRDMLTNFGNRFEGHLEKLIDKMSMIADRVTRVEERQKAPE